MKKATRFLVSLMLGLLIFASVFWYLFIYDRDFTRDTLLSQARFQALHGNSRLSSWFYDAAYGFSGHDENVAIELANQYKRAGNYTKAELTALSKVCSRCGMPLYMDGARLGYGLAAEDNDLTMADITELCDVYYIGGTKVGALFGEAVVIRNEAIKKDFRYMIKQRGGMLAKGRLLGVQFDALMTDNLYFSISAHADALADKLRDTLVSLNVPFLVPGVTNQLFPILPDSVLENLSRKYVFCEQQRMDETHRAVRFCTSWATREDAVEALCADLRLLLGKN